jgi:hypothetical protein
MISYPAVRNHANCVDLTFLFRLSYKYVSMDTTL